MAYILGVAAFALLIAGQIAAVIAVHLHNGEPDNAAKPRIRLTDVSDDAPRPQSAPHLQPT